MQQNQFVSLQQSKKARKDQETIQSSTLPDPGYHMGKYQKYNKHHQQEPRGQPFPSSDHKAAIYGNLSSNDLKCGTGHRGYPGKGIMEHDGLWVI